MKILHPYIDTTNNFYRTIQCFDNYAAEYNETKEKRSEQIRPAHRNLFFQLIHIYKRQLDQDCRELQCDPQNMIIDSEAPPPVFTNREELKIRLAGKKDSDKANSSRANYEKSNATKLNGSTIYRYILRLIETGVIVEKINHGSQKNFELFINPDLLLISDKKCPKYTPVSKYSQKTKYSENTASQKSKRAICTSDTSNQEHSNNIIMTVDSGNYMENQTSDLTSYEQNTNINTNTGKSEENFMSSANNFSLKNPKQEQKTRGGAPAHISNMFSSADNTKNKDVVPEGAAPSKKQVGDHQNKNRSTNTKNKGKSSYTLDDFKNSAARWFVGYLLVQLFSNKNIYTGERDKTLKYVQQYYFADCSTEIQVRNRSNTLKWRIDAAKRFIDRGTFDFSNIYPYHYVDLDNTKSGFTNTQKWFKQSRKYYKNKEIKQKKFDDTQKLLSQFKIYQKNPNLRQFKLCESYVKSNIPHLIQEFYNHFNQSVKTA